MRVLITAGPTREPVDPVRFLGNRSSGKMGYALAAAALEAGDEVTLVSGPVALPPPAGARLIRVETAREMFDAVRTGIPTCDAAIFAAAVADYRPVAAAKNKIKKSGARLVLELEPTEDILGAARGMFGFQGYLAGFAAETRDLEENAVEKLRRKGCDLIVANDVSSSETGFDSDDNEVALVTADRPPLFLPRASKVALAREILAFIRARIDPVTAVSGGVPTAHHP
jgi:phosphopantothenoylcysteine synthetase/decarboxylase